MLSLRLRRRPVSFRIARDEIAFLAAVLGAALELVEAQAVANAEIIELRDDLSLCLSVLEARCPYIPDAARWVENLGQPPWHSHSAVEQIAQPTPELRLDRS
jgi:hypothetical protein